MRYSHRNLQRIVCVKKAVNITIEKKKKKWSCCEIINFPNIRIAFLLRKKIALRVDFCVTQLFRGSHWHEAAECRHGVFLGLNNSNVSVIFNKKY